MQISLIVTQVEIEKAILEYITSQGIVFANQSAAIVLNTGRGKDGTTANVIFTQGSPSALEECFNTTVPLDPLPNKTVDLEPFKTAAVVVNAVKVKPKVTPPPPVFAESTQEPVPINNLFGQTPVDEDKSDMPASNTNPFGNLTTVGTDPIGESDNLFAS